LRVAALPELEVTGEKPPLVKPEDATPPTGKSEDVTPPKAKTPAEAALELKDFNDAVGRYYTKGQKTPYGTADQLLKEKKIKSEEHKVLNGFEKADSVRRRRERRLKNIYKDKWDKMSAQEKDKLVMGEGLRLSAGRDMVFDFLQDALFDPQNNMVEAYVHVLYDGMYISLSERDAFLKALDGFRGYHSKTIQEQSKALTGDLQGIFDKADDGGELASLARARFVERATVLNPRSETYGKDLLNARKEAIGFALSQSKGRGAGAFEEKAKSVLAGIDKQVVPKYEVKVEKEEIKRHKFIDLETKKILRDEWNPKDVDIKNVENKLKEIEKKWGAHISDCSRYFDVPEYAIYGMIFAESSGKEDARANIDAVGLMQISRNVAKAAKLTVYDEKDPRDDRLDGKKNIVAATRYLREMLNSDLAEGDIALAVTLYTGGSGSIGDFYRNQGKYLENVKAHTLDYYDKVFFYSQLYRGVKNTQSEAKAQKITSGDIGEILSNYGVKHALSKNTWDDFVKYLSKKEK